MNNEAIQKMLDDANKRLGSMVNNHQGHMNAIDQIKTMIGEENPEAFEELEKLAREAENVKNPMELYVKFMRKNQHKWQQQNK